MKLILTDGRLNPMALDVVAATANPYTCNCLSQPVGRSQAEVERLEREEQQSKAEDPVSSPERMMLISLGEVSDWPGASNISGNPLGVGLYMDLNPWFSWAKRV